MFGLANPERFMRFSAPLVGPLWIAAGLLLAVGAWLSLSAPPDYQQGDSVRIMFVHVPAASVGLMAYGALGVSCLFSLVWRHPLADAAARAAAVPGAALTGLALVTGAIWGKPMWGVWWTWGDARLTSMLVLFLFYVAWIALRSAIEDEARAARAAAVLGLVGLINLPIVKFSVDWWNTLHQPASLLRADGPAMPAVYLAPLLTMMAAYAVLFAAIWVTGIRTEVSARRLRGLRARRALEA